MSGNPYRDTSIVWGLVVIGGYTIDGVVLSVDGAERPEQWTVQKATDASGAVTKWSGTQIAEDITILVALHTEDAFDGYSNMMRVLRPKLGTKPPSLYIANGAINYCGITRVTVKNIGQPKWVASGGYWTGEIKLLEYSPSKPATRAGPADPPNPLTSKIAAAESEVRRLTAEAAKAGGSGG